MSAVYFDSVEVGHAPVECDFFRLHGPSGAGEASREPYLLTLRIRPSVHGHSGCYPQALAVVDDFGTLQIIGGWR